MNETVVRRCPLCREAVQIDARKCPHCHHYLNKWTMAAFHPLIASSPLLIAFIALVFFLSRVFNRGENFNPYRSQVRVADSQLFFGEISKEATVAVVGTLQNDSPLGWKNVELEVQFFDSANKLIDAKAGYPSNAIIPPHGHCAFKLSQRREFPQEQYHSFVVHVLSARDERSGF